MANENNHSDGDSIWDVVTRRCFDAVGDQSIYMYMYSFIYMFLIFIKKKEEEQMFLFTLNATFVFLLTGKHITLVSHSRYVGHCLEAAKELAGIGIEAEVRVCCFFRYLVMYKKIPKNMCADRLQQSFIYYFMFRPATLNN